MTGFSEWNKHLRSRTAAGLTLLSGVLVFLLVLQAVVGWPFHRTLVLRLHPAEAQGPGVYRGHVPADVPTLDWNAPLVRVFADGVPMVQYKSVERMMAAASPASFVKARAVFLRNPARTDPPTRCEVKIPWLPPVTFGRGGGDSFPRAEQSGRLGSQSVGGGVASSARTAGRSRRGCSGCCSPARLACASRGSRFRRGRTIPTTTFARFSNGSPACPSPPRIGRSAIRHSSRSRWDSFGISARCSCSIWRRASTRAR